MPARESEALVLRTYPYREADLIVVFLTRDQGKLRGVARGVRRPRSRFGASLERMAHARIHYFQKQTVELVRVDRGELLGPSLVMPASFPVAVALDALAELADELLPDHEPNDAFFRLLLLAREEISRELQADATNGAAAAGWIWRILSYSVLWAMRLSGWLPPLDVCLETGEPLAAGETAYFQRDRPGLLKASLRTPDSWALSAESRALAREMLRAPLPRLSARPWSRDHAADLRRFLEQRLEAQVEKRLRSWALLEAFDEPRAAVHARGRSC